MASGCLCKARSVLLPTRLFPGSCCSRPIGPTKGPGYGHWGTGRSLGEAEAGAGWGGSRLTSISVCIRWYPVLSSISKSFHSHSPIYPHESPRGKVGGRMCHQPAHQLPARRPCRGPGAGALLLSHISQVGKLRPRVGL